MADQYVITVVLEGNVDSMSKSMDNAASSQRNVKRATDSANISFLAQIARYQAMTAALNQTVGGFNKLAGGLDRLGFKESAKKIRKFTAVLEIIAGPAEIYLAYLTLTIVMGKKDVAVKSAQTAATMGLTKATWILTKALLVNPLFLMSVSIVALVLAFDSLTKKFDSFGKAIEAALAPLTIFVDMFRALNDMLDAVGEKLSNSTKIFTDFSDTFFIGKSGGS